LLSVSHNASDSPFNVRILEEFTETACFANGSQSRKQCSLPLSGLVIDYSTSLISCPFVRGCLSQDRDWPRNGAAVHAIVPPRISQFQAAVGLYHNTTILTLTSLRCIVA